MALVILPHINLKSLLASARNIRRKYHPSTVSALKGNKTIPDDLTMAETNCPAVSARQLAIIY